MNDVVKGMLIVLVILYIISPVDLAPGPIDDAIVLLIELATAKKPIKNIQNKEDYYE